ncbi:MAG: amidohydrolase family protein [Myxococcota bacterium]
MGAIDYWCNAFAPDRSPLWDDAIAAQGIPLKVRSDDDDRFATLEVMVERMDALGIDTLVLPCAEVPERAEPFAYERYATSPAELGKWASAHPGRFVGLASLDPTEGVRGLAATRTLVEGLPIVGLHLHTHSFDRRFDHRDLYPFYALAAEHDLAVVVQAGTSGGRMASECGRPIGIDRPALFFEDTPFVLSHTGWPWVDEAIAMALKHRNVFLGTAAYPPHHWPPAVVDFLRGPGRTKTLFGTSFPVVGHRQALGRLDALELDAATREALLGGNARRVFPALARD